ncbi:hypothetical protein Y032_0082g1592 [Ancylostoma ceylanicum]|nr:hypothetical protein Y032_0082g1592 [Ancylostoma ceylanicum]
MPTQEYISERRNEGGNPGGRPSNNVTKGRFERIANILGKCKTCVDDWDGAKLDPPVEPRLALAQNDVSTAQENPHNVFHFGKESVFLTL